MPIFMTDVMGYRRMIEWFPEGLSFDWGSFLGGSVAGIAAFILFMVQRYVDRKEIRRRQLAQIRAFCIRTHAIVKVALNIRLEDKEAGAAMKHVSVGFHAAAVQMSKIANSFPDVSEGDLESSKADIPRIVSIIGHHVDRMAWHFDQLILGDEISEQVLASMTDIAESLEKIRRMIAGCQSDANVKYWGDTSADFKKYVLKGPMRIVDALNCIDGKVSSLSNMLTSK